MESLDREKVLHVADLGRIKINEDEIQKFGYGLKQILDEINKIDEIDAGTEEILVSPTDNKNIYRDDIVGTSISIKDALSNAPQIKGNYVEVVRVIND